MTKHKSVLLKETIRNLSIIGTGAYVDLTLGGGGHSLAILNELQKGATLVVFDLDMRAIENFVDLINVVGTDNIKNEVKESKQATAEKNGVNIIIVNRNFNELEDVLSSAKIDKVDGIIADLGWSSDQLGGIEGLSYMNLNEELDMRFNKSDGLKAKDLLNAFGKNELKKMFERYADLRGNQNEIIVNEIIKRREKNSFEKVGELTAIVEENSINLHVRNVNQMHSRVFQSLRIAVNNEIENLRLMLESSLRTMNENAKLEIITFHSTEEKVVKNFVEENKLNLTGGDNGYISPLVEELLINKRARSAKLWVINK
ncbi:MAG: 16S rRNA (cytosine(1402)-N(4))-methyltransferase RsmH [Candidatus Dojkabacteria bacterium]|nr:16S rRNA (cytosine(1402)-N(4))-methyltransferase RsmH [Candidatus Dojkabacteria bacterium]MDQ7021521.1 16S rRNA (cytosine(1402)-N(4))-methyltransferase RsmH [Candidatus Dojkabacteria bacterium]